MDWINNFMFEYAMAASLLLGWIADCIWGDPANLPHPVVYMGKWIAWGEHTLNKGKQRKMKGAVFALCSIVGIFGVMCVALGGLWYLASVIPSPYDTWLYFLLIMFQSLCVFFCLAGKTLRKEVRMVFEALHRGLDEGRKQVGRIVGRDTQELSRCEVATAALETLAENLSDGVIAPLFWFFIFGVPGMLTYKMINTLDSMIGYQNKRYKDFGCWAAHIDDVANYIPARLTALLMTFVGWLIVKRERQLPHKSLITYLKDTLHFSHCHASPNSGWPEAALATLLNCRFGGPHNYFGELFYKPFIGSNERELSLQDMAVSIRICFITEVTGIALTLLFYTL